MACENPGRFEGRQRLAPFSEVGHRSEVNPQGPPGSMASAAPGGGRAVRLRNTMMGGELRGTEGTAKVFSAL
jgi:hypothetical protein